MSLPGAVCEPRAASLAKAKEVFQSSFHGGNPAASQLHLQRASNSVFQRKGSRGELVLEDTGEKKHFKKKYRIKVGTWIDFFSFAVQWKDKPHLCVTRHTAVVQGGEEVPVPAAGLWTGSGQKSWGISDLFCRWGTKWLWLTRGVGESIAGLVTDPLSPKYQSNTTVVIQSSPCS